MLENWVRHEKIGEEYLHVQHKSGLNILVYPKPQFHGVFAIFGTKFGSIDCAFRKDGRILRCPAGTAHFLEHKLFEGEEGSAFDRYAKTGASAGAVSSEVWDALMKQYQKTDPAIWSMLGRGRIISSEGNIFRWQTSSDKDTFFLNTLGRESTKKKISDALTSMSGRPCRFETVACHSGNGVRDDSEEAYINRLYETFGKEPVIVKD